MSKFMLPLNLQLFAVDDDGVDESDIPDVGEQQEEQDNLDTEDQQEVDFSDDDEEESEEPDDEPETEQQEEPDDNSGKNPTAAAVIAERKKWQDKLKAIEAQARVAERLMKQSGVEDITEMERRLDQIEANRLEEQGIDPHIAASFVAQQRQLEKMQADLRRQKYDGEVERLKQDAFFADIEDHREDLESIAERTGLTIEQAYMSIHGARRMKEREAEIEARVKANQSKRDSKKVNTNATSSQKGESAKDYGLSPEQLAAARFGVKKGHFKSIGEYAKLLKS